MTDAKTQAAGNPTAPIAARLCARPWPCLATPEARRSVWLFAFAFLFGLVHGVLAAPMPPHHYFSLGGHPWNDALVYHSSAIDLLRGDGLREGFWPRNFLAPRAPGYGLFLAMVYAYTGPAPYAVAVVQLVLHAAIAVLAYRLAARAFGQRIGLLCGLTMAFYRTQIDFAHFTMTEVLATFLAALALLLTLRAEEQRLAGTGGKDLRRLGSGDGPPVGDGQRWPPAVCWRGGAGSLVWAGLLTGYAATVRSLMAALAPVLCIYLLRDRRRLRPGSRRALLLLAAFALPLLVASARTWLRIGVFSPAATVHVFTAWSELATPRPDSDERRFAQAFYPTLRAPEREVRESLGRQTTAFVIGHPLRYLRRVYHLLVSNLRMPPFEQPLELSTLLLLPLTLAALLGCAWAARPDVAWLLCAYAVVFLVGTAALGNSSARFRLPVDFALFVVAGAGLLRFLAVEASRLRPAGQAARATAAVESCLHPSAPTVDTPDAAAVATIQDVPPAAVPPVPPGVLPAATHLPCPPWWRRPAVLPAWALLLVLAYPLSRVALAGALPGSNIGPVDADRVVQSLALPRLTADWERQGGVSPDFGRFWHDTAARSGEPGPYEGKLVVWAGVLEPVVHLPAGRSDPRSPLLDQRPEGRLLCAFAVEGAAGTRGGTRIWAELPDALGFRPARPVRAVVVGRVHTEQRSLVYERMRVVVLALRQL